MSQAATDASATILEARSTLVAVQEQAVAAVVIIQQAVGSVDRQLTGIRADVRAITGKLDAPLESVTGIRDDLREITHDVQPILSDVRQITNRLQESSDTLLDCRGNGACLPAQTLALVGSARYTMGQVARAAPEIARAATRIAEAAEASVPATLLNTERITADTSVITREITHTKRPWWLRWLGFRGGL